MNSGRTEATSNIPAENVDTPDGSAGYRKPIVHIAIILAGALGLAILASYDTIWFDEGFSIAIAQHPLSEIVSIGSTDVHPVLYYFILRAVFLVFGPNVYAFRLVSVLGTACLSLIGFTHIRKDLGISCGMLFSALVYLIPWSLHIALQIRMYSWTAVAILFAAVYAWRIVASVREGGSTRARLHWWVVLTISSACAAYLHYYGAMAAFCVQLIVLANIALTAENRKRNLLTWALCAFIAILSYVPWLVSVIGQTGTVSQGFWIDFSYPASYANLASYPFGSDDVLRMYFIDMNSSIFGDLVFFLLLLALLTGFLCAYSYGRTAAKRSLGERDKPNGARCISPVLFYFLVFIGTAAIAGLLSEAIHQPILHARYISVNVGALMVTAACVLTQLHSKAIRALAGFVLIALGVLAYSGAYWGGNNPINQDAIDGYKTACERATELNGGTEPLVFASDEGTTATVAMSTDVTIPIMFLKGDAKYKAFEPRYVVGANPDELLEGYTGSAVFIGSQDEVRDFIREHGGRTVDYINKFHAYSGRDIGYAVISYR